MYIAAFLYILSPTCSRENKEADTTRRETSICFDYFTWLDSDALIGGLGPKLINNQLIPS